jgi:putative transposase
VVAAGVTATGDCEVLGFDVGDNVTGAVWTAFLRSLRARLLDGVQLVISDHHEGLKSAISSVMIVATLPGAFHGQRVRQGLQGLQGPQGIR